VNVLSVREILDANARMGRRPDALTEGIKNRMQEFLQHGAEQYQEIKAYFGAEHVLNQKKFLLKVPMTEKMLKEIYGGWAPPASGEVWGVVMIQKRAELEGSDNLSLDTAGYAEDRALPRETYEESTRHLLYGDESLGMSGKEALLGLLGSDGDNMRSLIARAEHDKELGDTLKDLTEKMISYFEKTGMVFDMVGDDNIAVMKENGYWTYKFVDAIYPGTGDMRASAQKTVLDLAQGEVVDKPSRNDLMNTLNFVRTVNGLAEFTGSEKRIRIIPDEVYDTYIDFQEELRKT